MLIHSCLTAIHVRRTAIRLIHAAMLTLAITMAIPAHAADDREVKSRVAPVYPEIAKRMKISGTVKVEVTVNPEGKVSEAKALNGNRMLTSAAEEAVRQWKFMPGSSPATVDVEITFAL